MIKAVEEMKKAGVKTLRDEEWQIKEELVLKEGRIYAPKNEKFMEGCNQCQRMKNRAEMPAGKLRPNQVPERPWQHISVGFITKLPMFKGHDSILVVCDRFLKMSHFVVTTEKTMAEGLARLFRDNVL